MSKTVAVISKGPNDFHHWVKRNGIEENDYRLVCRMNHIMGLMPNEIAEKGLANLNPEYEGLKRQVMCRMQTINK